MDNFKVINEKPTKKRRIFRATKSNMPAILTFMITLILFCMVCMMILSHTLGPMDRQFLSIFAGTFSGAFATACSYWFDKKAKINKK